MHSAMQIEPDRRPRRVYVARWRTTIGASFMGGVVLARRATALGRQIFVTAYPCGTIRHLSAELTIYSLLTKN